MKKNIGFTLIELIIVIAIMAVMTAILVPSFVKYVALSRERVCQSNLDALEQACLINTIFVEPAPSEDVSRQIMKATLSEQNIADDGSGHYYGICPGKGDITIEYDTESKHVYLKCSEHGVLDSGETYETSFMKALLQIKNDSTNQYASWTKYWSEQNRLKNGSSINSASTDNGTGSSFASDIKTYFSKLGVDATQRSWRIYRKDNGTDPATFDVYLADVNIDHLDLNSIVNVTKYDFNTDPPTVTTGTAPLKTENNRNQTYNVIYASKFTAAKQP